MIRAIYPGTFDPVTHPVLGDQAETRRLDSHVDVETDQFHREIVLLQAECDGKYAIVRLLRGQAVGAKEVVA